MFGQVMGFVALTLGGLARRDQHGRSDGVPSEQYQAPRTWAEQAYPNLIHFKEVDRGGHFAAWEQPELFSTELREAFRSLRT